MKNKLKALVAGTLGVCAMAMVGVAKVEAIEENGTYSAKIEDFYDVSTNTSNIDSSTKIAPTNTTVGKFSFTKSGTNYLYTYGNRANTQSKTLTNTTGYSWDYECMIGGGRTITVTIGELDDTQIATLYVYGYADGSKTIKIDGTSFTPKAYNVTGNSKEVTGTSTTIELVTNYVLLEVKLVISTSDTTLYTMTYYDDDRVTVLDTQKVAEGNNTAAPTIPTKTGYEFVAWVDADGNTFDFENTQITSNTSLYATWIEKKFDYIPSDVNSFDVDLFTAMYEYYGAVTLSEEATLGTSNYSILSGCIIGTGGYSELTNSKYSVKVASPSASTNAIKLTLSKSGTITIYGKNGSSSSDRAFRLLDAAGNKAESDLLIKNTYGIVTFDVEAGTTYYLGGAGGNMYVYGIYFEADPSATFLAQYDTATAADATKIRFVAVLDNITDVTTIDTVKFTLTYNETEKTFACTKLYSAVKSLGTTGDYEAKENRYFAVYTIAGDNITAAIKAGETLSNLKLTITFTDGTEVVTQHADITLGSTLA